MTWDFTPKMSPSVSFGVPHFLQGSILSLLWRLPQDLPPKLSSPVHYLFPHFHLNLFLLYPTDTFNFYPSELPYLSLTDYLSLPHQVHSLCYRSPQILPPKFSVHLRHWVLHFYLQIFIFYHGDSLKFYPPDLPTCPQQFPQFTPGCSCSLLDMTTFYPLNFPYLPNSDHFLFTSKHEFLLLQINLDFITKMSILSPVYWLDFKTKATQVMSVLPPECSFCPLQIRSDFFSKNTYGSYIITSGFAPQILPHLDYCSPHCFLSMSILCPTDLPKFYTPNFLA